MRPSTDGRASWWRWPIATRSTTCSIARPANSCQRTPYAKQTWAERIDAKGRPVRRAGTAPTRRRHAGLSEHPGRLELAEPVVQPADAICSTRRPARWGPTSTRANPSYKPGEAFVAGGGRAVNGDDAWGAVRALDATTGKLKWEFKLLTPPMSGVLSTAGGLVFGGTDEGNFFALDADTRQAAVGHSSSAVQCRSNPMSFSVGRQAVRRHRRGLRAVRVRAAVDYRGWAGLKTGPLQ